MLFYFTKEKRDNIPAKGQLTGVFIPCENCGVEIYRTPYRLQKNKHQFCSTKCQNEYDAKVLYEDRACEICGKTFHVRKSYKQRFCSHECQNEWQRTRVGTDNPRFTSVLIDCEWCNKEYCAPPCKIENKQHNFCSTECRQAWFANVWSQQKEWKKESSKRALRILSDGLIPNVNSKPQIIINNLLDTFDTEYINEYIIGHYSLDVYLKNENLIIEVMGDYWHTNPNKHSIVKYPNQRKIIGRDKAKHSYFVNNHDIEILYLWESDIQSDIDLCRTLISKYIDQKGELDEYHSFNYYLDDNQLCLNRVY